MAIKKCVFLTSCLNLDRKHYKWRKKILSISRVGTSHTVRLSALYSFFTEFLNEKFHCDQIVLLIDPSKLNHFFLHSIECLHLKLINPMIITIKRYCFWTNFSFIEPHSTRTSLKLKICTNFKRKDSRETYRFLFNSVMKIFGNNFLHIFNVFVCSRGRRSSRIKVFNDSLSLLRSTNSSSSCKKSIQMALISEILL